MLPDGETNVDKCIADIPSLNQSTETAARARLDNLLKPKGSLGRLEDLAVHLACVQGSSERIAAMPATAVVCAGDHGVHAQGVSAFPQEITCIMVDQFLQGRAAVSVMAEKAGIDILVVDVGCAGAQFDDAPKLKRSRVACGTADMTQGPAMTLDEARQALAVGMETADEQAAKGHRCVCVGEMGIANTTPAAALYCALLGLTPVETVGPGAGLDDQGVLRKIDAVQLALDANSDAILSGNALKVLAAVGGLEIACMAGLIIGCARNGMVPVVDGYISAAAYAVVRRLCPNAAKYAVCAHVSGEPHHAAIMRALETAPLLNLGMRLGEGTGAVLAVQLLHQAAAIYNEMGSFDDLEG